MSGCSCVLSAYDGDGPEFSVVRTVVARKSHRCCECHSEIGPGEGYECTFGTWDGDAQTFKVCSVCASIRDAFFCDGFAYGNVMDDLGDHLRAVDGNVSSDCMLALTPAARERVCEMIEDIWKDRDEQEDEDDQEEAGGA